MPEERTNVRCAICGEISSGNSAVHAMRATNAMHDRHDRFKHCQLYAPNPLSTSYTARRAARKLLRMYAMRDLRYTDAERLKLSRLLFKLDELLTKPENHLLGSVHEIEYQELTKLMEEYFSKNAK